MRVGEKREQRLRWYGAVIGAIRMEKIYRGDPQGAVGATKETFQRENIY